MVNFMGFGRKGLGPQGFGRKAPADPQPTRRIFARPDTFSEHSPFDRFYTQLQAERDADGSYVYYRPSKAIQNLTPEERGELLADLADRPGVYDGSGHGKSPREGAARHAYYCVFLCEIEVRGEHLGSLIKLLLGDKDLRERRYSQTSFDMLLKLMDSAIKQGAYLSSGDCEALSAMAADIRSGGRSYSKTDTKKMILRAEKLEKFAGAEVSATEFLMRRCEGAENPWAIDDGERPNAQFWANLLSEVVSGLEDIRRTTKGGNKPAWLRDPAAFAATWPAVGDVTPRFGAWDDDGRPFASMSQHNGKRTGFADAEAYRSLPDAIPVAQAHSRYLWSNDQIPGLDVLADLENPEWTALVEMMITQRRATKATGSWRKSGTSGACTCSTDRFSASRFTLPHIAM